MQEPEAKLCEPCWKEKDGLAVEARWFPSGVPMCDDHHRLVCQRCRRQWYTGFDALCDECRVAQTAEDARRREYNQHLDSKQWWKLKKEARRQSFKEHGGVVCARCGMSEFNNKQTYGEGLHGHHRTYERFGQERVEDVELLCSPCHASEHRLPAPKPLRVSDGYSLL